MATVNSIRAMRRKIEELSGELDELSAFSKDEFIEIIQDVGFLCTLCGRCCTREFNDHVFLLDDDVESVRQINSDALIPAPYYHVCDRQGNFYVSGYALRCKTNGDCLFLEKSRCRIYDRRFRICRIYPYMLHREEGRDGTTDWRQISGINEHGEYHTTLTPEQCEQIADETMRYEKDFLQNEIEFYTFCATYFKENDLRPVRKVYDRQMREFGKGTSVTVFVFDRGRFNKHTVRKEDYQPSSPQGYRAEQA